MTLQKDLEKINFPTKTNNKLDPQLAENRRKAINYSIRLAGTKLTNQEEDIVGFPKTSDITQEDLTYFYNRDPQANREINKYSSDPFKKPMELHPMEEEGEENDAFHDELHQFYNELAPALQSALKSAMIDINGRSLIYMNFKTSTELDQPITNANPFSNDETIHYSIISGENFTMTLDPDPTSEQFNQPTMYTIKYKDADGVQQEIDVHPDRCALMLYNKLPGKLEGMSHLLPSYNMYLFKHNFEYAMSEGYWRNGNPLNIVYMPIDADDNEYDWAKDVVNNINAKTHLMVPGGDPKDPQGYYFDQKGGHTTDPGPYAEYIHRGLSAMSEVILFGVVGGQVTGAEINLKVYYDDIKDRQDTILWPLTEDIMLRAQAWGLLSEGEFVHEYPPLFEMDDEEQATVEQRVATAAAKALGTDKTPPYMSVEEVRKHFYHELPEEMPPELVEALERFYSQPIEPETPFGNAVTNQNQETLSQTERKDLMDKWIYPIQKQSVKLEGEILPIYAEDMEDFENLVLKTYGAFQTANKLSVNQPTPEQISEFTNVIEKFRWSAPEMERAAFEGMSETFRDSAAFAFSALGAAGYSVGNPEVSEMLRFMARQNTLRFYSDVNTKALFEVAEGIKRGEDIRSIQKRLQTLSTSKEHHLRAMARTLTKDASNEARRRVFESEGVDRVVWINGPNPCPECAPLDGMVMTLSEASSRIPVHIQCQCDYIDERTSPGGWRNVPVAQRGSL